MLWPMPYDIRFAVPNRPGATVECLDVLASYGVNVEGVSGDLRPGETWGFIHILVDDAVRVIDGLEHAGIEVHDVHEVEVLDVENRPGGLADALRSYLERGDNLEVMYIGPRGSIVLGTESMRRPRLGGKMGGAAYFEPSAPADH